ncbi:class I SAM-dependent methyltransferase [Variovorax sp. J22R133]|uniref:class I SAM-dependent methyltransferase n=1 Tax=Variovorax brevis TaxID=3053503 RepID=UPI002575340B|nr:class I SAM-dependent methyltransferase [Variovorax sp. J22R133]MDM0110523.1 class I SAM-dependent methyltransferase [Variovorax sp. J22R133]
MTTSRGVRRRESFDQVAQLYDGARPGYPQGLIHDLVDFTALREGHRVLEIGCGTGQLTAPLGELGAALVAVELGSNLAAIARQKLSRFGHAEVVVADFDQWILPDTPFDLVVAATAFHWLDPATRIHKCADALRPGGTLAVIETHWGVRLGDDPFSAESQSCYERWDPGHDPAFQPPTLESLLDERDDLASSQLFAEITHRRYRCDREYNVAQYCDLLGTFSNILAFDEPIRAGFLACIADLIQYRFGGKIVRNDLYDLWLARTSA